MCVDETSVESSQLPSSDLRDQPEERYAILITIFNYVSRVQFRHTSGPRALRPRTSGTFNEIFSYVRAPHVTRIVDILITLPDRKTEGGKKRKHNETRVHGVE